MLVLANGLDADLLDAQQGTYYLDFPNFTNLPDPILTLDGDVSGVATFTDLGNATLSVTIADDSHNHVIANVDGLPALETKLNSIEANATSDQTKSDIDALNIDADTLDGIDSTGFATSAQGDTADSALQSSDIGVSVQAHDTVLDNTTASYTTAEETKLSGIEDGATAVGGDWTIQDLDHNEYASLYSNSAGTEGVRVEYNASSKSLEYNFF